MSTAKAPIAVFICNTSLHIMNAMEACKAWGLDPAQAWIIIKTINNSPPAVIEPVLALANWGDIIWIGDFPVEGRGILSFWKFQYKRYQFHRAWQKQMLPAKGVARVFVSYNRMIANRIVASWLGPREIIWLDDGTLSYALVLDSVLPPEKQPKSKVRRTNKKKRKTTNRNEKSIIQGGRKLTPKKGQV